MTEGEGDDTGDVPLGNTAKPDKEVKATVLDLKA